MEAFSLLKYWRTTTGGGATANLRASTPTTTTTISTAISHSTAETDDDEEENGPFFDLEFAVPDEDPDGEDHDKQKTTDGLDEEREDEEGDSDGTEGENDARGEEEEEGEGEFKFTLEPSDDLFFNGNLVPVEPSSIDDGSGQIAKPQFSLLKSASKFGVLMLKLKKSKQPNAGERTDPEAASVCLTKQSEKEAEAQTQKQKLSEKEAEAQTQKQKPSQSKLFTVKFKVEEVPIVSLFTRDNSSRASSGTINNKSQKKETSDETGPDEKRVSKDGVQKYLKMVKPLYIRVSKRHGEKPSTGFSGQLSVQSPARPEAPKSEKTEAVAKSEPPAAVAKSEPPAAVAKSEPPAAVAATASCEEKSGKQGKLLLPAGLRVVCKHLGKSRSASSAAVAAAPVSGATVKQGRRRDDSLLEQQDGIQSAIMHCKRSFNLSRGT